MKIHLIILITLSVLVGNCSHKNNKTKLFKFDEVFTYVDSYPLETQKAIFINPFKSLQTLNGNKWYVCDYHTIYLFDKTGKFISKFGREGQGPKEFVRLKSIAFNSQNKLVAFDTFGLKVAILDTNLNFITSKKIDAGSSGYFLPVDSNYYFYNRNLFEDSLTLKKFNSSFEYQYSLIRFPYNSVIQVYRGGNQSFTYAEDIDKIFVTHLYDPFLKIFSISSNKLEKQIPLHFPLWKNVDEEKVKKYFKNASASPKKLFSYLEDKLFIYKIFYLGENNIFVKYANFKRNVKYLQYLNINRSEINFVIELPDKEHIFLVKDGYSYFVKSDFEESEPKNPTIIKYKINKDFYRQG